MKIPLSPQKERVRERPNVSGKIPPITIKEIQSPVDPKEMPGGEKISLI